MTVHVVQTGETLWGISKQYNVPIPTISEINGLESLSDIVPGQALYLPQGMPIRFYQIKAGDTLWSIARRFQTSVPNIIKANPTINPNQLYIGQGLSVPSRLKLNMSTLGFIVPYSVKDSLSTINNIANNLTYLAIVAYSLTDEGYAYVELEDVPLIERSKQLNVNPLLMVRNFTNGEFSPELIGKVLNNPTYRRNLILSLVNLAQQKGYGGVSIDFEFVPPPQRANFTLFLQELKRALGELILHVNVHAKTEDIPTNRIIGAYDYLEIGKVADIVAVMTIDYGYPTGPPNPVSPIWWMEEVVRYSVGLIPVNKLQIAFPLYGYDWTLPSNETRALSLLAAQNLAISTGAPIHYDEYAASPYYRYWRGTEAHIVWFEDIRSYIEKYKVIDLYTLLGTTFWQVNLPFPQNWAYIRNHLSIRKTS